MTTGAPTGNRPRFDRSQVEVALGIAPLRFLGQGAFADTWTNDRSAFKVICVDNYPESRLERERQGLMRVANPHVVKLLRVFDVSIQGRTIPVLEFEYIDGGDLAGKLQPDSSPTFAEARALLLGLLDGVMALHNANSTLHRDIKPQNIALRDGNWSQPVLLDLGMAKSLDEQTITVYPGLIGTPLYMAPEQLRGERALKASDLFSIGATVREALLGRHPFYLPSESLTIDEALARLEVGPEPLPADTPVALARTLDRLVNFRAYKRRTAQMNYEDLVNHA